MRYVFILIGLLLFVGCSKKEVEKPIEKVYKEQKIYDLVSMPQNIEEYTKDSNLTNILNFNSIEYEKSYFSVWNMEKPTATVESIGWAFNSYRYGNSYGENLQLIEKEFFDEMREKSNFDEYQSVNKKGITLRHLNIRAFPTSKPLLLDPSKAGEGFPFDYLQNSTIQANKPIFISHYSSDGEWAHIFSSFTYGWVKSRDIVLLKKQHTDIWQDAQQVFLTKENKGIYTIDGNFLFKSKIGTMLALVDEDSDSYTVLTVSSLRGNEALFQKAKVSKIISTKGLLAFTKENLESIVNELADSKYGWGGMYAQRDCSSMLRDMYAPFGVWLPRNSYQQSKVGKVISFDGLNDYQKIALIKDQGVPFKTLLYKKGHIMLYIGVFNRKIAVFHDTWGIKTEKDGVEGRIVIGKPVFSTLKLGRAQKHYDKSSELLTNLKSMNILEF